MGRTCVFKLSAASMSRSTGDSPITLLMLKEKCPEVCGAVMEVALNLNVWEGCVHTLTCTVITIA